MVAITVILAAFIGAFVLNIGGSQEAAPQATFTFNYDQGANDGWGNSSGTETVLINHEGGAAITGSTITLKVGGTAASDLDTSPDTIDVPPDWTAGQSAKLEGNDGTAVSWNSGNSIDVVWGSPNSDKSSIVASGSLP